jgi:hypothetical protein
VSDPRERIIEETLSALALKHGTVWAAAAVNPRDALMDEEERADSLDENRVRVEAANRLLDYLFQFGEPNPEKVMKLLFALVRRVRPGLLNGLTMRQQAKMFGETPAAVSWRVKQLGQFQRSRGAKGWVSRAEKTAAASESYRRREEQKARRRAA